MTGGKHIFISLLSQKYLAPVMSSGGGPLRFHTQTHTKALLVVTGLIILMILSKFL